MSVAEIAGFASLGILVLVNLCGVFFVAGKVAGQLKNLEYNQRGLADLLETIDRKNGTAHKNIHDTIASNTEIIIRTEEHARSTNGSVADVVSRIAELEREHRK